MFNYRSMSDVELLNAYREILVAKRRQILWRAMENHNAAEKKIPNPGADHEKLAVLSSGSSCCTAGAVSERTCISMPDASISLMRSAPMSSSRWKRR